jgi:hypothetical protein
LPRSPYLTVIGNFTPDTVAIKIFGAGVVGICFVPAIRVTDCTVARNVPIVPIIAAGSAVHPILRAIAAADGDQLSALDASAALGGRDFRGASADDDLSFIVGIYENAKFTFAIQRTDRGVRSIDLRACFTAPRNVVGDQTLTNLDLNL